MAIKKKKLKYGDSVAYPLRTKQKLLKKYSSPNYSLLFETLSKEDFMNFMFHKPFFIIQFVRVWRQDYSNYLKHLNNLFGYMDFDDIYEYIKINHSLNIDADKRAYTSALFRLFTDLFSQVPSETFESFIDFDRYSNDEYIFGYELNNIEDKSLVNMAREIFYYGKTFRSIKDKMNHGDFLIKLNQIYQSELLPINISEETYLF